MSNHFLLLHYIRLFLILGGKYEERVNLNRTSAKKRSETNARSVGALANEATLLNHVWGLYWDQVATASKRPTET